jgi:hypothetical protein
VTIQNVSVFRYTDGGMTQAGATTGRMSGTAGDRLGLLNSILRDGYNWQEVTNANLTQTGNVATLSLTGHGFNIDQRLWIVGMDQSGYLNGTTYGDTVYPTAIVDGSTLTFAVTGNPTSPVTTGGGAGGTTTTLNGAISSTTATSITVTDGVTHYPGSIVFVIKIDSEYMLVTGGQGTNTWTVVRGWAASTAATHSNGATVTQKVMVGVAPAGGFNHWTTDFTTTNKSTYRSASGNRFFLELDDTNTTYGLIRGYETYTGPSWGSGQGPAFPTTGQVASGSTYFCSSNTASTASRPWAAIATDRFVIVWTDAAGAIINQTATCGGMFFGDLIDQTKSGDGYATLLIHGSNAAAASDGVLCSASVGTALNGHYLCRSYTQTGGSQTAAKAAIDSRQGTQNWLGAGGLAYPHGPDGAIYLSKVYASEGSAVCRGTIPGFWAPLHNQPIQTFDTFTGTGTLAGKKFIALKGYSTAEVCLEISNTIPTA